MKWRPQIRIYKLSTLLNENAGMFFASISISLREKNETMAIIWNTGVSTRTCLVVSSTHTHMCRVPLVCLHGIDVSVVPPVFMWMCSSHGRIARQLFVLLYTHYGRIMP